MNEELTESINEELAKVGANVISDWPDVSEETATKVFDLIANEKDTVAMANAYDTQSKESIDCSLTNEEINGLPITQMLNFEDILASVQNDFASITGTQENTLNEVSSTNSNE
jgi:hypothetical protein